MFNLEETYREAAEVALGLRELVPGCEAEKIMEKVEQEDVEIHKIKRSMVSQMTAECNLGNNETKGKSPGAKGEEQECSLVNQDRKSREDEEDAVASISKDVSKQDLKEELKRIGLRLENQRSLVSDLLKSNDTEMMNREVQNLDKVYDDYVAAASQLRTLSLKKEAEEVSALIDAEDANVFQVKQLVSKWMVSQAEAPIGSAASRTTGHVNESLGRYEETSRGHIEAKEVEYRMAKDTEKKVQKSEKKTTLEPEELAASSGKSVCSRGCHEAKIEKLVAEVEALKKEREIDLVVSRRKEDGTTTKEPVKEVRLVNSKRSSKEEAEISELREEIEAMRRDMHKKREMSERTENMESIVPGSTSTLHDAEIIKLRAEIATLKRGRQAQRRMQDGVDEMENKLGDNIKAEIKVKVPSDQGRDAEEIGREIEAQEGDKDVRTTSLVKLNELMVQTLKLQAAPKAEIDTFSGDPLEYNYFVENFKDVVENMIDDPRQRLVRLLKYTRGDAKELIKHCVHEQAETCYNTALALLEKEYGSPFRIGAAYLEKLKGWPQIRNNDPRGLRELYRFLIRCESYQKKGIIDLNSPLTIRTIQLALPASLQDKWTGRVAKIRKKRNVEASFADFVEYVEEESNVLNDPVYARGGGKEKGKLDASLKTCLTDVVEGRGKQPKAVCQECKGEHDEADCPASKSKPKVSCHLCKAEHDLDDCQDFAQKAAREKKDFLFRSKLCFLCYGNGHVAKDCTTKRTCKTCGETHPTGLHGVTFKVSVVYQDDGEGTMCIVPVRVSRRSSPEKEVEVYAMLDECSTGTFISEELAEEWAGKRKTTISMRTLTSKKEMEVYAIDDLRVRGVKEFQDIYDSPQLELPITYTQEAFPMDREDIPDVNKIAKWEYLREVLPSIPHVKDIPLGLLIGRNCKKALEPVQVIASKDDGPYAKRSHLGWCVVGSEEGKEGGQCSLIKVCNCAKDVTYCESPKIPQVVLDTKITDVAISEALQKMYRIDFVERNGEKNGLSKEDRTFLDMMRNNVDFCNGHYQLPLPLRVEEVQLDRMEDERECATSADKSLQVQIVSPEEVDLEVNSRISVQGRSSYVAKRKCVVIPRNRNVALQRLKPVKRQMLRKEGFKREYIAFMKKLFAAGHAGRVPEERKGERAWYLSHHGVYHPTKGKIRVVFDCSAEKDGVSLNNKLMQGPDFTNSLLGVLLRFRKGLIPVTADIEAMYYQVGVPKEQWKFLRFFWWEDDDCTKEVVECEMRVHPFGAVSSKSCVTFALHQTAFDNEKSFGEEAMQTLLLDFYVDDWLKSLDDEREVVSLVKNTVGMCAAGGFNLTKFVCPNQVVMDSIPVEKHAEGLKEKKVSGDGQDSEKSLDQAHAESALGMQWLIKDDTLGFRVSFQTDNGTRLGCLSTISRIPDPCGLLGPFLLKGRKILQKMTANSVSWHQSLPDREAYEWGEWRDDVAGLNDLKIRRCYRSGDIGKSISTTLHCFSDASFVGYGVACYLRMVDAEGRVEVSLVMGKSRVSPLKPTTVPRLELTAAAVSAKLAAILIEELKIPRLETFYWVDNKIVLGYICNSRRRYRVYVANRVQMIEEYTQGQNWRYVMTKDNPADYASRGISPKDTGTVERHFMGPEFLRRPEEYWRSDDPEVEIDEADVEVKVEKKVNAVDVNKGSVLESFERRISSWHRMKRVMAWVRRFISNCKAGGNTVRNSRSCDVMVKLCHTDGPEKAIKVSDLMVHELEVAEREVVRMVQERELGDEIRDLKKGGCKKKNGKLWRLNPFLDEFGILRVGGRLANANEDGKFKFPVIIPKKAICTRRLIEWHHNQIQHRGKHSTVSRLREFGFWVVNSGWETGSVVFRCVRCKWLRGRCGEQKMADLPASRMSTEAPFTYCGMDVFGPVEAKEGRKTVKRYGVLFTCLSLRAVHVEIASSLETDSFLQALTRFISRRGAVRELRSDNGTNFLGADNELKKAVLELDQERISAFLSEQGCDWIKFERNTPMASHMGGVWERQIRTVKSVLASLVKSSPRTLDEETLRTFFAEAEAIVNSRPLTIENLHDPDSSPLSPNHILTMKSRLVVPPPGVFQSADMYCRKRWRIAQHLANCFWSRWRKEYLQSLQSRQKWTDVKRNLQVDDVVLLKEEGVVRGHWPMGRVAAVHPGEDGLVRSVTVQAGKQMLKRPVNKTVLLSAVAGN